MSAWLSIESAPMNKLVLVCKKGVKNSTCFSSQFKANWRDYSDRKSKQWDNSSYKWTHWQPLPEPPK